MTTATRPATEKQLEYIRTLVKDREVSWEVAEQLLDGNRVLDINQASLYIGELLKRPRKAQPVEIVPIAEDGMNLVRNGTYTIQFEDGSHLTLRLKAASDYFKDLPKGTQVAQYMSGPDNESSYTGFAFVQGHTPRIWKRYRDTERITLALRVLLSANSDEAEKLGLAYAMESGNCYRCGRKLTVPASICRGLGPVCNGREE